MSVLSSHALPHYDSDSDDDEAGLDEDIFDTTDENQISILTGERFTEAEQLSDLKQIASAPSMPSLQKTIDDVQVGMFGPDWVRPTKAVKKVARYIRSDGSECIEVSFKISEEEVDRVENEYLRKRGLSKSSNRSGVSDTSQNDEKIIGSGVLKLHSTTDKAKEDATTAASR